MGPGAWAEVEVPEFVGQLSPPTSKRLCTEPYLRTILNKPAPIVYAVPSAGSK